MFHIYIVGSIFILFCLSIFIYILLKNNTNIPSNSLLILQSINNSFSLDNYKVMQGDKVLLTSGGKWNLGDKNLYVMIGNTKVNIDISGNKYHFNYKHDVILSGNEIIVDNYSDVFNVKKIKEGYEYMRNDKLLANIIYKDHNDNGIETNIYNINIKNNEDYLYIYIICFIILNQIDKDINISLD